jgi:hypothetical protein
MHVDALAREVAGRFMRGDVTGPPFPPYFARWAERMRAHAERALGEYGESESPELEWPPFESFERVGERRIGDLDVYVYRIEPTASALLLALRGDALAYTSFAGGRFMGPEFDSDRFPPYDLALMATHARGEGELDLSIASMSTQGEGPVQVAFAIEPERFAALDGAALAALVEKCTPIARDVALLFCGRPGPLTIVYIEPDPPATDNVRHLGVQRTPLATFEIP